MKSIKQIVQHFDIITTLNVLYLHAYLKKLANKNNLIKYILKSVHWRGMECTQFWTISAGKASHDSHRNCHRTSYLIGLLCTFLKSTSQRWSMDFKQLSVFLADKCLRPSHDVPSQREVCYFRVLSHFGTRHGLIAIVNCFS